MLPSEIKQAFPRLSQFAELAIKNGRLAHAFICGGQDDQPKELFIRELALILNCTDKSPANGAACRTCLSCLWILADQHVTALIRLEPDLSKSKKGIIRIDQVRNLQSQLSRKSGRVERCVIICPAEQEYLPPPSANALLKTIEEPNPGITFFLLAHDPSQVLPTIQSRCQPLHFPSFQTADQGIEDSEFVRDLFLSRRSWYECCQILDESGEANLSGIMESLRKICLRECENSRSGKWLKCLEHIEEAERRLKYFCNGRHVCEELFWRLNHAW